MIPDNPQDPSQLRYSICVSGAAGGETLHTAAKLAEATGAAIAKRGHIIVTGATVGLPYSAARGAKKAGGMSIGFSPARSFREHLRKYRLPHDCFDFINFTGMHYVGRDLYLVQSSDAIITVGGRIGSLNEFANAVEAHKPCGVLLGSGGAADIIPKLIEELEPEFGDLVTYDDNPERLVEKIIAIMDEKYADIYDEIKKFDQSWFLKNDDSSPRAG